MEKFKKEKDDLLKYYTQTKQRIDLNIDMNSQKIIAQTKLTFLFKNEKDNLISDIPDFLYLHLNGENIIINNIKIIKCDFEKMKKKKDEKSISFNEYKNMKDLEFKYSSPICNYKNYLDNLFQNIEELESYKNIKRIEWEIRQKGNIIIKFPKKLLIEQNNQKNIKKNSNENLVNVNNNNNENLLIKKIKIVINYILIEKNIGIIFQQFNEHQKDKSYIICYTPNFYFNTQNWVPCIYNLILQITWSLYLYIPDGYMSYSSCLLNQIIKDESGKKLIIYKNIEKTTARNIGFIIIKEKYYTININQNFIIVSHKDKKENIENNLIKNKLIETLYDFHFNFFDINSNIKNTSTSIIFIPYILFDNPNQGFNKFIKLKEDTYFSFIKFPNLYILPEKYIYNENIPEISKFQLKMLSKLFISNYIGGLIIEKSYADFWIINGLESYLSNLFLTKLYNDDYIKIKIYKWLLKFKKECKKGKETLPLYTNNYSNPIELQLNPIFNLKCKIFFHLLESKIGKDNIKNIINNIIHQREKEGCNISTQILIDKCETLCGIKLNNYFELFVYKTGMMEINLSYNYDTNNNFFEYKIQIENIAKNFYENHPLFSIRNIDYDYLNKIGKKLIVIDSRIKLVNKFDIKMNMEIIQRNGIEIKTDFHEINNIIKNEIFPLSIIPRKSERTKVENEFLMNLIENTGIKKVYTNVEINNILSRNLILCVKIDSDISSFRINKIKQQHILFDYIKLFKDDDYIGKLESLYNLGKEAEHFQNSIEILKYFIKNTNEIYRIKNYAIKIYVKIIIKMKKEDGYLFLLEILDDYFDDLLKDKTNLNLDIYYIIKIIIKYLCEYKNNFFSYDSTIYKKIKDKFLLILTSNDFDNFLKFDNCYFISDIILICSEWDSEQISLILMELILKIIRIEKIKRSFNEKLIISSLVALNNLVMKNNFFCEQINSQFKEKLSEIFFEINFFMNNDCENYELIIILHYFQIFMEFYKCQSYIEFSDYIKKYILGEEYNNNVKMSNFSMKQNLNMISKIKAFNFFINNHDLNFDTVNEKIEFLSSLKIILYSPICYLREDCRNIMENIYDIFFNKEINLKGAGNNNFYNISFLHLFNKNRINYASKKYADPDWLNHFIATEGENDIDIELNDRIKEFNNKYNNKCDDIFNIEINSKKSFNELISMIFNKLMEYSVSKNYLGDLYEKNKNIIIKNIDFNDVKNKISNKLYHSLNEFNNDLCLLFDNYLLLNEKNEMNLKIKQLKEYYEIISYKYKQVIIFKENEEKINQKIIDEDNIEEIINSDDEDTFQEINGNDNTKKLLNKKRKL